MNKGSGAAFISVGIAFLVIGITNTNLIAFVGTGVVFLILGLNNMRQKKE